MLMKWRKKVFFFFWKHYQVPLESTFKNNRKRDTKNDTH
jgi:hypothetical protein